MDEKKFEEIQKSIEENVSKDVLSKLAVRKDIFGGNNAKSEKDLEAKTKAVEFVKAMYAKDFASLKAMNETTGADGGFLVPEYFASELIRVAGVYGVMRRNARMWSMQGKSEKVPTSGSVTAYRVGEGVAITSSKPTIQQITLTVKKVAAMVPMTNELLKDANLNTIDYIISLIGEAIAYYEDNWGFNGTTGTEGILRNTSVQVVILGSGETDYVDANFDDLLDMVSLMASGALVGAKWYMHPSVFNALRKIKAATTGTYIFQEPAGGRPATIWNYPVEIVDVLPATSVVSQAGTKFLVFGNLKYVLFGDRGTYEMKISEEATVTDTDGSTPVNLFEQDMSAVRVTERVDFQLAEPDKAFVVLKTAAS